jgi:hypothetical protein
MVADISCPGTQGNFVNVFLPRYVLRSEPQNPMYFILSKTSPAFRMGCGKSAICTFPGETICIDFMFSMNIGLILSKSKHYFKHYPSQ